MISVTMGVLIVWVQGLPGPQHGYYRIVASLHNINSALKVYDAKNGHLPPATGKDDRSREEYSWRVEVYQSKVDNGFITASQAEVGQSVDYERHLAWNDPRNLRLQGLGVSYFEYVPPRDRPSGVDYSTYFKAITGPDTAFESTTGTNRRGLPHDLILIARVEHSDTHWLEPGDLTVAELVSSGDARELLLGKDGYAVLFADGDPWVLDDRLPFSDLCRFFTIAGAKQHDRDAILGPFRVHPW